MIVIGPLVITTIPIPTTEAEEACRAADEGLAPAPSSPSVPKPAARVGDRHECPEHDGGPVSPPGSPNVWIEGRPAARSFTTTPPSLDLKAATVIQKYAPEILAAAAGRPPVDPLTLAAIVYVEQMRLATGESFADEFGGLAGWDTSIGLAQVTLGTAKLLETQGRMPAIPSNPFRFFGSENTMRVEALADPATNLRYAAANLRSLIELWKRDYPKVADDPEILATLHNLGRWHPDGQPRIPNDHPCSNDFGKDVLASYDAMKALLDRTGADCAVCSGGLPDLLWQGSATVLINGLPATRVGDQTLHRGQPVEGATTVWIG